MADVVTHRNDTSGCFCQLRLDSGERILISIAQKGIRVSKLALGGLIPTKTLFELGTTEKDAEMFELLFAPLGSDPDEFTKVPVLDHIVNALKRCRSIAEVLRRLDAHYHASRQVQQVTEAALMQATFEDACKRTAYQLKSGCEALLRSGIASPEDTARLGQTIARCNVVLSGDDVFSEEELRLIEQTGGMVEAVAPDLAATLRKAEEALARKAGT